MPVAPNLPFSFYRKFIASAGAVGLWASGDPALAAPAVKLADHPTSRLTAYPGLHSARKLLNRIYFGYGDWNGYCATTLVSYDPAANVLAVEHSVASDSVEMMREIDGVIYVPHCDPVHHEDFHDYSWRSPDGRWLQSAAMELVHVFDFTKSGSQLICAANDGLHSSEDDGRTWKLLAGTLDRQYWCIDYKGTVYANSGRFVNGRLQSVSSLPYTWNHTTPFHDATTDTDLVLGLTGISPGIGSYASGLSYWNGTTVKSLKSGARSFTAQGGEIFVLSANSISKTSNPLDVPPVFTSLDITGIPASASCLELMDGKFYIGTTTGEIWVANADGSPVTMTPPVVENRIPDSYGRGLALEGDRMLVGAPNAFAAQTYLAGKTELWQHTGTAWQSQQEWAPPLPDFSGWYGRDVAIHGDLMAVVEAGSDKSNQDRGANAKVHVWQLMDGVWTARTVIEVAFAHTVAIQDDIMVVGTSNQAANQADGWPGVNSYAITRDAANVASLTPLPQLKASSGSSYGYKSLVRVALMDNLLVVGYSGDPSRTSVGSMDIFRRDGAGFNAVPVKKISVTKPQRYGFGLAADAGVIAVGAPFEDTGAANAGAVFVYEAVTQAENPAVVTVTEKQILRAPSAQAHGEFGAAVALHGDLLLVGSPGREVNGVRQRGAVYKYRRQASGTWAYAGEVAPPAASDTEFGIEVACNDRWLAAGSLGCAAGAAGLTSRVRVMPRSGYEEWLDARLITSGRLPADDADGDGLPTLMEYTSNLPPDQPVRPEAAIDAGTVEPAGLPVLGGAGAGGVRTFSFVRPKNDARVTVSVESSSDLTRWETVDIEPEVMTSGTTHELVKIQVPTDAPQRWWRVKTIYSAE